MNKNKPTLDSGSLAIIGFATMVVMNLGGLYGAGFYLFGTVTGMMIYSRLQKSMKAQEEEKQ